MRAFYHSLGTLHFGVSIFSRRWVTTKVGEQLTPLFVGRAQFLFGNLQLERRLV